MQGLMKEKEQHDRHLRQLEEEMESQMANMEEQIRQKEQERLEADREAIRKDIEDEMKAMQQNLKKLKEDGLEEKAKEHETMLISLKARLDDQTVQNRQLQSELTDSKTVLGVIKSDLTKARQLHQEKCHELKMERQALMDYIKEQDNLKRQLHLLHDANQQLLDTNDNLQEALETSRRASPLHSSNPPSEISFHESDRRGSVMSDYLNSTAQSHHSLNMSSPAPSLCEEPVDRCCDIHVQEQSTPRLVRAAPLSRLETSESVGDEFDSGHSTMRDLNEQDSEPEDTGDYHKVRSGRKHRRIRTVHIPEEEEAESHDEMETDVEPVIVDTRGVDGRGETRPYHTDHPLDDQRMIYRGSPNRIQNECTKLYLRVMQPSENRVSSCGYAKENSKNNLTSTLGVDFQTTVLDVDGKAVALQLWDTAGQERFRSIAKSYFRRADGVLLLYDCTYERSFLNVREWVEAINDSAQKQIPIMLAANKTDMRAESMDQGRRVIQRDDGQRLAREFEALFIETSAKDGSNVHETVIELSRLLQANEDLEVKTVGLQLHNTDKAKKADGGCC
ncbi:hypothetical protein ScPMuIL_010579 [Solemya velum]